ncbi:MAG TPA: RNA methyltransferase [Candidatus Dormibacteraeota bacterium]|nr:RNA methyltransferase [Candidatus Dormibacteraeota bacterium]
MPSRLGAHADRIGEVRDLLTVRGRREQQRFAFEGATLLDEALRSGVAIESIYATEASYEASPAIVALERDGTQIYLVDDRTAAKISDLQTPTGIVAVAPIVLARAQDLFEAPGLVLILADLNDPGNAGTLLRSAEAFGATTAVFGRFGVDPHHPKVVRGSMGATFRLRLCVAEAPEVSAAARARGALLWGLDASGEPLQHQRFPERAGLVVGHERRGLGAWGDVCDRRLAIQMRGSGESLNAAVAGSIALYAASLATE